MYNSRSSDRVQLQISSAETEVIASNFIRPQTMIASGNLQIVPAHSVNSANSVMEETLKMCKVFVVHYLSGKSRAQVVCDAKSTSSRGADVMLLCDFRESCCTLVLVYVMMKRAIRLHGGVMS